MYSLRAAPRGHRWDIYRVQRGRLLQREKAPSPSEAPTIGGHKCVSRLSQTAQLRLYFITVVVIAPSFLGPIQKHPQRDVSTRPLVDLTYTFVTWPWLRTE